MKLQELANQVRETPLCDLLQWHGFEIKSEGVTFRAKNDRHSIFVTGNRWFDNKAGLGGLGAIHLQMHLTGEDFTGRLSDPPEGFSRYFTCRNRVVTSD
jgi:hypothetical protein